VDITRGFRFRFVRKIDDQIGGKHVGERTADSVNHERGFRVDHDVVAKQGLDSTRMRFDEDKILREW
jgi:hypothetical protein